MFLVKSVVKDEKRHEKRHKREMKREIQRDPDDQRKVKDEKSHVLHVRETRC